MPVRLEAQMVHNIESAHKIEKCKYIFEKFIKEAKDAFSKIIDMKEQRKQLTKQNLLFLIDMSEYLFDEEKVAQYDFFENHIDTLITVSKYQVLYDKLIPILDDFYDFIFPIPDMRISKFRPRKQLNNLVNSAKKLMEKYKKDIELLQDDGCASKVKPFSFLEFKNKTLDYKQKIIQDQPLTVKELDNLLEIAESSITHLNKTGELYFDSHSSIFNDYKNLYFKVSKLREIFLYFHLMIEFISKQIPGSYSNNKILLEDIQDFYYRDQKKYSYLYHKNINSKALTYRSFRAGYENSLFID